MKKIKLLFVRVCCIYCDKADCGWVSGGRAETGAKGTQSVVVIGYGGLGRYVEGRFVGGTDGGGGGADRTETETETKIEM